MLEGAIIFILLILIAAVAYLIIELKKQPKGATDSQQLLVDLNENLRKEIGEIRNRMEASSNESRKEVQSQIEKINSEISSYQKASTETIQKQFSSSYKIITEVTEKLTSIEDTNKQVLGFAEQMRSLENILQNPKQRGILGEYFLEALLNNILQPNQYKMQYKFSNGEIVDAAIFFNKKIIPVDSKFSLEKYNQMVQTTDKDLRIQLEKDFKNDIKNRIDETAKYIRPDEDTTEFAFMFIPAEGVYYNLLIYNVGTVEMNTQDLIEYAFGKRVIIVSPTSFYAYLETVLQGLKALKFEESVKDIIKRVGLLGKHLNAYEIFLNKLGKNLSTTVNMYNDASKEFKKIDKDVVRITDANAASSFEPLTIDKPNELTE
ncbi:MAG: DNA recombination protein RmuC [Flavobacteriales bacterium]|nr:DNA recombination protein RmuC [Flavobacteriales bacterium]